MRNILTFEVTALKFLELGNNFFINDVYLRGASKSIDKLSINGQGAQLWSLLYSLSISSQRGFFLLIDFKRK